MYVHYFKVHKDDLIDGHTQQLVLYTSFAQCFYTAKIATAAIAHSPLKKQKDSGINTKANAQGFLLYASAFGFLSAFANDEAYKKSLYAKAASYHFQSSFVSLSFQQFYFSCSFYSALCFQQALSQAFGLLSLLWCFCLSFALRLVCALLFFRSSLVVSIALLRALNTKAFLLGRLIKDLIT